MWEATLRQISTVQDLQQFLVHLYYCYLEYTIVPIVSFYSLIIHSYLHPLTINKEERKNVGGHLSIHLVRIIKTFQVIFEVSRLMYTEKY